MKELNIRKRKTEVKKRAEHQQRMICKSSRKEQTERKTQIDLEAHVKTMMDLSK
jgi:hypothetical protein